MSSCILASLGHTKIQCSVAIRSYGLGRPPTYGVQEVMRCFNDSRIFTATMCTKSSVSPSVDGVLEKWEVGVESDMGGR